MRPVPPLPEQSQPDPRITIDRPHQFVGSGQRVRSVQEADLPLELVPSDRTFRTRADFSGRERHGGSGPSTL